MPRNKINSSLRISLGTAGLLFAVTIPAQAAQWYWTPQLSLQSRFNDNQTLATNSDNENSAFGNELDARVTLGTETPTSIFRLTPRARIVRYTGDDSDFDSEDGFVQLFGQKRTETMNFQIGADYAQETTLTSELASGEFEDPDLDDPQQDDTGLVDFTNTRVRWNVSPSFSATLGDKTGFRLSGRFTDISYDEDSQGLVDNENARIEATIFRNLSERTEVQFTAFGRAFEAPERDNETDSLGGQVALIRDFDDQLQGTASVGFISSDFQFIENGIAVDDDDTAALFTLGLRRRFETGNWRAEISRTVNPSGAGFLTQRDQFRLQINRRFTETWTGRLIARAFTNEAQDENVTSVNRDYFRLDAGLVWRMTEKVSLDGQYSFIFQDYEERLGNADSNQLAVTIRYTGLRRGTSR
ncbi:MAG: hypothetical protein AAF438_03785 [Pseudomonadota bacterium]